MPNVIAVVDALVAPDPSPLPLRDMWWQRSVVCVSAWLEHLVAAERQSVQGAPEVLRELRRLPRQQMGRALNRPVPLWCLNHVDPRMRVAGAALAACDAAMQAEDRLNPSLATLCAPLGSPLALMGAGRWLDPLACAAERYRSGESANMGATCICLIGRDPVLAGDAIDRYPKLDDSAELAEFGGCLAESLLLLGRSTPGFARAADGCLSCVVPMRAPPRGVPSASTNSVPGAVCITVTSDAALVAEQLTHELSHAHLFALQECDPLLEPDAHGDGWGEPLAYSPWRDDARPLNGLLHGAVVFSRVAWLHAGLADRLVTSRRRLAAIGPQIRMALDWLGQRARMTAAGSRLLRGLTESERMLGSVSPAWSGTPSDPLYVECSSILDERGAALDRQRAHRARCAGGAER